MMATYIGWPWLPTGGRGRGRGPGIQRITQFLGKGKRVALTPDAKFNETQVNAPQWCHVQGPPLTHREQQQQQQQQPPQRSDRRYD
ncbi:hypothetical protein AWZ03_010301 [Drosophila navojoa]|uniref:Uncharacterized protein n=1 Tax=Drosophila navojoa TaxID=7232 RepID=A0A484B631_DRONA|nr:hypothetical protein AWZ03_010301 [Drosophila navojoa]